MRGTAFIYSSHDRSHYIHNDFIVQRALSGWNKRILFLPMSEPPQHGNELSRQDFAWDNFRWFFDQYWHHGLEYFPFHWREGMHRNDVEALWHWLWSSDVVILGGGNPATGMWRYKELGARYNGEWGLFGKILHERRQRGLLTVGFSAGADQLCESLFRRTFSQDMNGAGFGLVRNTMVTLHHDSSMNHDLWLAAQRFPNNMVFGLPNDSGINHDWGHLPSGNIWQAYEFVLDNSWDSPNDGFHIRTRQGAKIEHIYNDGRHWNFGGGDMLVRVESPDGHFRDAWMRSGGQWLHYWTQWPSHFHSAEHILASH
jgi:hypothetical protein